MSSEENKALGRRFIDEVFNEGNLAAFDELASPDFVDHGPPPLGGEDREAVKKSFESFRAAFPDMRYEMEDVLSEGDRVVVRGTFRGSQTGEFLGVPATGKHVTASVIDIVRLEDGKVVEHWNVFDRLGIVRQLGIGPTGGVGG